MTTVANDRTIEINPIRGSNLRSEVAIPEKLSLLGTNERPKKGWGCFRVLTAKDGDKRITWDSGDLDQINDAKQLFDELKREGLTAYRVGLDGRMTAEEMDAFDPDAEEVIFIAKATQVIGG
jgi:hypothetical protein